MVQIAARPLQNVSQVAGARPSAATAQKNPSDRQLELSSSAAAASPSHPDPGNRRGELIPSPLFRSRPAALHLFGSVIEPRLRSVVVLVAL
jgi:hypothetical protein